MSIREWLHRFKQGCREEPREDTFINIESPCVVHADPRIKEMLLKVSETRREMHWTSWKMYQLEKKPELSEFEKHQLKALPERLRRLAKIYRTQDAELRQAQGGGKRSLPRIERFKRWPKQ